MKNCLKALLASLLLTGLGACAYTGCNDYQAYSYAKAAPPITVPADLDQPVNESVAPVVKVEDPNTLNKTSTGECLDTPPNIQNKS